MAIKDVKLYYYNMMAQFLEMKADLADFEEAVAAGHIEESQLTEVIEAVDKLEQNYDRLSYIMYLLELPNRSTKKVKHQKETKQLRTYFENKNADKNSIIAENKSMLDHIRAELKKLGLTRTSEGEKND